MKVTALQNGITIIDDALSTIISKYEQNIALKCVESRSEYDERRWFDYAAIYDTTFNLIESSNQVLKEYGQTSETDLEAPFSQYRTTYTKDVSMLLSKLRLIELDEIKSIETWVNMCRRDVHIDRDESKPVQQSIDTNDWPEWSVVTYPDLDDKSKNTSHLYVLPDSVDKIPVYFEDSDPERPNWWVLREEFFVSSPFESNDELLLKSDKNWTQVDYKPGRIIVFPGNCMHFTTTPDPLQPQEKRIAIPLNFWPKVYGEDKIV